MKTAAQAYPEYQPDSALADQCYNRNVPWQHQPEAPHRNGNDTGDRDIWQDVSGLANRAILQHFARVITVHHKRYKGAVFKTEVG